MKTYPYTTDPKIRNIMARALNVNRKTIRMTDYNVPDLIERQKSVRFGARLAVISMGIFLAGELK